MPQDKRPRLHLLIPALLALLLVFAACGSDPDDEEPSGSAGATETGDGGDTGGTEELTTLEEGLLTVGSDIPYPPFEYRKDGELIGLDIDLMNEIATRLDLEAEYTDTSFDTIFTQLAAGRYDAVVAASTITPEREQQVNFSDPYYKSQQSLTINTGEGTDIASIDELAEGDVVGVQNGTTGKTYAEENVPEGVELRSFKQGPDAFTALEAGQVIAVIHDEPTALAEVATREGLELVQTIDTGENFGIAVNPENEALLDAINETLAEIVEDGTYQEIYDKYEDLPPGGSVAAGS